MKFKRIGRVLVCLLLVSALLINASPIKAKATGAAIAAPIVKAATVTCNPWLIVGAAFIGLGLAAAANPEGFQNMVDAGVSALESAGTWIKDGMVELLRTEDADGNASYYVDSGMMEAVRLFAYDNVLSVQSITNTYSCEGTGLNGKSSAYCDDPFVGFTLFADNGMYYVGYLVFGDATKIYWGGQNSSYYSSISSSYLGVRYAGSYGPYSQWDSVKANYTSFIHLGTFSYSLLSSYDSYNRSDGFCKYVIANHLLGGGSSIWSCSDTDLSIGNLSSVPVDGSSARQWSEEYTDRGLKVYGGGSGNNNNDGKWFWKVMIPLTAVELLAMSQADQWSGETPKEFDDYSSGEEFEIVSRPEVEFGQGLELAPVTSPSPDSGGGTDPTQPGEGDNPGESTEPTTPGGIPDIGGGDNPDPGGDGNTGTESGNQTDYTNWFERIIKGIEELPSKFAEWFNNISTQLERIIEGITTLGQNFAQNLQTLGQNIVEGIRNAISSLFSPSPDYFTNKVEALKAKHHNIDKFTQLGNDFKLFFTGLGSKPPIIWIDLGAATGAYLWGGRQIFLDLTWYADYKPKMDAILGAIIWLWLAWRVFLSVPGIINGASGVWGKYHRGGSRDDN